MKVVIENICKKFDKLVVLDKINLQLESGKIMCLLGPSGSGKTTLIRILTGALKADSGRVMIGNYSMPNMKAIRKIGFMPQNDAVYLDITGLDNLLFFGRLFGMHNGKLKERSEELLEMLNLWESKDKLVSNYSGGMKKRLSLAISLLHEPELMILDEPTVGIDPILRNIIWEEFHRLQKHGKTIIVSTHVMDEVKLCDSASLLYNGKILESDIIEVLISKTDSGDIEELFIRSAEGCE